jgi:hypothetical protein
MACEPQNIIVPCWECKERENGLEDAEQCGAVCDHDEQCLRNVSEVGARLKTPPRMWCKQHMQMQKRSYLEYKMSCESLYNKDKKLLYSDKFSNLIDLALASKGATDTFQGLSPTELQNITRAIARCLKQRQEHSEKFYSLLQPINHPNPKHDDKLIDLEYILQLLQFQESGLKLLTWNNFEKVVGKNKQEFEAERVSKEQKVHDKSRRQRERKKQAKQEAREHTLDEGLKELAEHEPVQTWDEIQKHYFSNYEALVNAPVESIRVGVGVDTLIAYTQYDKFVTLPQLLQRDTDFSRYNTNIVSVQDYLGHAYRDDPILLQSFFKQKIERFESGYFLQMNSGQFETQSAQIIKQFCEIVHPNKYRTICKTAFYFFYANEPAHLRDTMMKNIDNHSRKQELVVNDMPLFMRERFNAFEPNLIELREIYPAFKSALVKLSKLKVPVLEFRRLPEKTTKFEYKKVG